MTARGRAEALVVAALLAGVVAMCQPFSIALFRAGFFATLLGTIAFVAVSHVPERKGGPR